jgi:uncharacterized membrane protein
MADFQKMCFCNKTSNNNNNDDDDNDDDDNNDDNNNNNNEKYCLLGIISRKVGLFMATAVRTSNPKQQQ